MHLVNIETLELQYFQDGRIPPYAILSHRWGEAELTYKEVSKKRIDTCSEGYVKLQNACRIVADQHYLHYLWIDTCCIDKRSSAELSEAINSMYIWYQKAEVCIVYLTDVVVGDTAAPKSEPHTYETNTVAFQDSIWFTRSWTLQELIAPDVLYFYDRDWQEVGTRMLMIDQISMTTKIPKEVLSKQKGLASFSIAQKMSWAASRNATREEDMAYSLLGIFDVNIPLLYGEGKKAFQRLQEEIIRTSTDRSFLFWGVDYESSRLLAESPAQFSHPPKTAGSGPVAKGVFSMNNVGLEIELPLFWWDLYVHAYCFDPADTEKDAPPEHSLLLLLRLDLATGYYYRIGCVRTTGRRNVSTEPPRLQEVTIVRNFPGEQGRTLQKFIGFRQGQSSNVITPVKLPNDGSRPNGVWEHDRHTGQLQCRFDSFRARGQARFEFKVWTTKLWVDMSFDSQFRPCILIWSTNSRRVTEMADSTSHAWQPISISGCEGASIKDTHGNVIGWVCRSTNTEGFTTKIPESCFPNTQCMVYLKRHRDLSRDDSADGSGIYFEFGIRRL